VSFSPSINRSAESFVLVHTDVWGPSHVVLYSVIGGSFHDFSGTTWVYLLKDKSDAFFVFQMFHKMI
jgi:hypothetical protein